MDRFEFVVWLQITGFVNHPTHYTKWLKIKQNKESIKLWITDKYTVIRFSNADDKKHNAASYHYTFEDARDRIIELITGNRHD